MAQKAKKELAKANTAALNNLHIITFGVNALFVLFNLLFKRRSLITYLVLSIPAFVSEFILETSGRPKYDGATKTLRTAGEDLGAAGLTEYMWDIIYITWLSVISVILFGNKAWFIYSVVPAYGLYKGYGLLGLARGLAGGAQQGQIPDEQQVAGNRRQRRAA